MNTITLNKKTEGQLLSEEFGLQTKTGERTAETVALEIRTLQRQAQGIILNYAIEIGRRLEEAKAMLPHGAWGAWLQTELDYSPSTAQNFMRIYREYGDGQQSMFRTSNSQALGNLTYTKALRLLAIPDEEERVRFAEENDVEHMSTRELEEALKARDAAQDEAAAAQEEAETAKREIERIREKLAEQAQVYEAKLTARGVDAEAAEKERDALQKKLDKLQSRPPEPDKSALDKARKEAVNEMTAKVNKAVAARRQAEEERNAAKAELENLQRELDALRAQAEQRKQDPIPEETAAQLRELEKKLTAADPDIAEFKVRYAAWQEEYQRMSAVLGRVADEVQAAKLRGAVAAALAQMKEGAL